MVRVLLFSLQFLGSLLAHTPEPLSNRSRSPPLTSASTAYLGLNR